MVATGEGKWKTSNSRGRGSGFLVSIPQGKMDPQNLRVHAKQEVLGSYQGGRTNVITTLGMKSNQRNIDTMCNESKRGGISTGKKGKGSLPSKKHGETFTKLKTGRKDPRDPIRKNAQTGQITWWVQRRGTELLSQRERPNLKKPRPDWKSFRKNPIG